MVEYKDRIWYNASNISYLGRRFLYLGNLKKKMNESIKKESNKKSLDNF